MAKKPQKPQSALEIIITHGIPASGKSTYAKKAKATGTVNIERDLIRSEMQSTKGIQISENRPDWSKWKKKDEKAVTKIYYELLEEAINDPETSVIILSDTNLNVSRVSETKAKISKIAENAKRSVQFKHKIFHVTYEEALKRDINRQSPVGQNVIYHFWRAYLKFHEHLITYPDYLGDVENVEGIDGIVFKNFENYDQSRDHTYLVIENLHKGLVRNWSKSPDKREKAIIVDVDGTIASMFNKNGTRIRNPFDWDKVNLDRPLHSVYTMAKAYALTENAKIIIVTGRDGVCCELTKDWLKKNNMGFDEFFIRGKGDTRKDTVIKAEIYLESIVDKYDVVGVFDDRPSVCRMWRDLGIANVIQLGDPYAEF